MCDHKPPFREVNLFELTDFYVLLSHDNWLILSTLLMNSNLSKLSRKLKILHSVLRNIRDFPDKTISVTNLIKLSNALKLDLQSMEKSIRGIRFSQTGDLEKITFPFKMDIYSWRAICHIIGDGTLDRRYKFPSHAWTQKPKNQEMMRTLLGKLSRRPSGRSIRVNFPKGLTYVIIAAIPDLKAEDLKTNKFVRFVLGLPSKYRNWKVQFLAAFLIDDGSVSNNISFAQKDINILTDVMQLCDQLGYDHSPYPPDLHGNGRAYIFRLYQTGIIQFYEDLQRTAFKDPLLGLWHKQPKLDTIIKSYDLQKGSAIRRSREICCILIEVLGDHKARTIKQLQQHPKLKPLIVELHPNFLLHRLYYLCDKGFIQKIENENKHPYLWKIPDNRDPITILREFTVNYGKKS